MDTLRIWGTDGQDTINATARGKQNVNLSVIGNGGHGDAVKATNYTDGKTYASTGEGQGDRAVAIAKGSGDANAFDAGRKGDERLNYGNTVIAETESGKAKAGSINSFDSVVSAYSTSGNARSSVENSKQMTLNATTYQDSGTATAAFEKSSHGDATVKSGSETQSKSVTTVEDSRESISR
jgi:hypothetical protein